MPNWKSKLYNDEIIKKNDTITIFSKNQNWLTVTPEKKDRRKALEKKRLMEIKDNLTCFMLKLNYIINSIN